MIHLLQRLLVMLHVFVTDLGAEVDLGHPQLNGVAHHALLHAGAAVQHQRDVGEPAHRLQQMLHHGRVLQVQLYQLVVALPALVPKAVVILGIAVKIQMEPVLIRAVPFFLLHVPERPKAPPHMIENPVQHHL